VRARTTLCAIHPVDKTKEESPLTHRELEVARLLCAGLSMRGVAHLLKISEQTVSRHKAQVYSKLGVRSQGGLIWWAIRERLIEPCENKHNERNG